MGNVLDPAHQAREMAYQIGVEKEADVLAKELEKNMSKADAFIQKAKLDMELLHDTGTKKFITAHLDWAEQNKADGQLYELAKNIFYIRDLFQNHYYAVIREKTINLKIGKSEGGKKGGGKNKKVEPVVVRTEYNKLTIPKRDRAAILAKRFNVTPRTIRNALNKTESE